MRIVFSIVIVRISRRLVQISDPTPLGPRLAPVARATCAQVRDFRSVQVRLAPRCCVLSHSNVVVQALDLAADVDMNSAGAILSSVDQRRAKIEAKKRMKNEETEKKKKRESATAKPKAKAKAKKAAKTPTNSEAESVYLVSDSDSDADTYPTSHPAWTADPQNKHQLTAEETWKCALPSELSTRVMCMCGFSADHTVFGFGAPCPALLPSALHKFEVG